MKKLYVKTFGCQMNVYDSSRMVDLMMEKDYVITENIEEADMVIINTCHIREKAKEKIFSELGRVRPIKQKKIEEGGYLVVVIAGCVAKAEGAKIFKRMPIVDIIISGESYHKLPNMVGLVLESLNNEKKQRVIDTDFYSQEKFASLPNTRKINGISEFVAVQAGCDKFCSYCVVPYTRGREYSRPVKEVIDEVKILLDKGVKEITLLGQNVDNYNGLGENNKAVSLAELIYKIHDFSELERIRYTTSYPSQFNKDLIIAHRDLEKLMPFIHLPAQSGSNSVLESMNRKYTREQYLEKVAEIREFVPNVALSSDFIVGFAGESEKDFEDTISLVEQVKYASSFSFKYSPRPNTVGIKMPNQIPEDIKQKRLEILQEILDQQQIEFNNSCIGKTMKVLVENESENNKNVYFGRTPYLQAVMFENISNKENIIGTIQEVQIKESSLRTLKG